MSDALLVTTDLTPTARQYRGLARHLVVVNDRYLKLVANDIEPLVIDSAVYTPGKDKGLLKVINLHLEECEEVMLKIEGVPSSTTRLKQICVSNGVKGSVLYSNDR